MKSSKSALSQHKLQMCIVASLICQLKVRFHQQIFFLVYKLSLNLPLGWKAKLNLGRRGNSLNGPFSSHAYVVCTIFLFFSFLFSGKVYSFLRCGYSFYIQRTVLIVNSISRQNLAEIQPGNYSTEISLKTKQNRCSENYMVEYNLDFM